MKPHTCTWVITDKGYGERVEKGEGPLLRHQNPLLHMGAYRLIFSSQENLQELPPWEI